MGKRSKFLSSAGRWLARVAVVTSQKRSSGQPPGISWAVLPESKERTTAIWSLGMTTTWHASKYHWGRGGKRFHAAGLNPVWGDTPSEDFLSYPRKPGRGLELPTIHLEGPDQTDTLLLKVPWFFIFLFFFYFLFFKHLYWSIIALQWCVSFCFLTKWISYTYTYVPISLPSCVSLPPSLSHPSRWSQITELISLCYAAASH